MLLEIDDSKTTEDIRERFNECFPFLRIEFYGRHKRKDPCAPLQSNQHLGDIRKKHDPSILEIKSVDRIQNVIHELKNRYGLVARIFRKHQNQWQVVDNEGQMTIEEASELASVSNEKNAAIIESVCGLNKDE